MPNKLLTMEEIQTAILRPMLNAIRLDIAEMQANPTPEMMAAWGEGKSLVVHFPGILSDTIGFGVEVPAPDGWKPVE
jgi:hypothetical protein